ncbi:hypothetical protein [Myxococcus sp. RHSTA-1-4]|uniref:hypothetical protein n=1 Tax=Myxococcus sp. RHSTA-1-4 TaxID=2874601 RepID=UPI001CBE1BB7|nr:hypothetical protein [Myxococcus sp. RHSTA-1-4]MBZ4419212.1 hypothetical protein [Myxococcus sp. RHSTA-1-4]
MKLRLSQPFLEAPHLFEWVRGGLGVLGLVTVLLLCTALGSAIRLALPDAGGGTPTPWVMSPLPFFGQLSPFELKDAEGSLFGTRRLRGGVYVLQFLSSDSRDEARATLERLSVVWRRLEAERLPVRFVVVDRAPPGAAHPGDVAGMLPGPWHVLEGGAALEAEVGALLRETEAPGQAGGTRVTPALLVDQAGGLRGVYDLEHEPRRFDALVEDVRCVNECGPVPAVAGLPPGETRVSGAGCQDPRGR